MHAAVSLTHVRYIEDDFFGVFMAWMSLLPVFIAFGCFPTHMLFRRDLRTMFFCFGLLCNDVINHAIKYSIKQPRPPTCEILESCDSFGMPSAHTQFMCFFATFVTFLAFRKLAFSDKLWFTITAFISWPLAVFVGMSRVYLGYHTTEQVFAGGSLGILLGSAWYLMVSRVFSPRFPEISESFLGRYLCIKDDSHIPNVARFEYEKSLEARQQLRAVATNGVQKKTK